MKWFSLSSVFFCMSLISLENDFLSADLTPPPPPVLEATKPVEEINIPVATPDSQPSQSIPIPPPSSANFSPVRGSEIPSGDHEKAAAPSVTSLGISTQNLKQIIPQLNALLAQEYLLYTKTLHFHWHVKGIIFPELHALFKEQYETLFEMVDALAERVQAIDVINAPDSLQESQIIGQLATLNTHLTALEMVQSLLKDQESIIRFLRTSIATIDKLDDPGTTNLLQDFILRHEKMAWMLRATAHMPQH